MDHAPTPPESTREIIALYASKNGRAAKGWRRKQFGGGSSRLTAAQKLRLVQDYIILKVHGEATNTWGPTPWRKGRKLPRKTRKKKGKSARRFIPLGISGISRAWGVGPKYPKRAYVQLNQDNLVSNTTDAAAASLSRALRVEDTVKSVISDLDYATKIFTAQSL